MTRLDLENELERLAEGFDVTLRKVRVDAFWARFGFHRQKDFTGAIDAALLDPRFPSGERLAELLERYVRSRCQTENLAREEDARRLFAGEREAQTVLGQFYAKAIPRCMAAPYGEYAAMMADLLAGWVAEDPARDRYFPEAKYWAEMAALPVIERSLVMRQQLTGDNNGEP